MATTDRKKMYIAKDGEILYDKQIEQYLYCVSAEQEFGDQSEIYIKHGYVLHGKEALKQKLADDVRDALKISGINKWLDKLESEAKAKKNEKVKQSAEGNTKNVSASVAENLSKIHKKLPSKVQNSTILDKTLEETKDACQKMCDIKQKSAQMVESVAAEVHKKLPSELKSVADTSLQVAKHAWNTGQDVIRTATEAGKVIQSGELPEVDFSGNADSTRSFRGHATPLHKTSDRVRVGEAQLQLEGHLHSSTQLSGKFSDKNVTLDGEFDADLSANAEVVGLDIQTGDYTKQGIAQQSAIKATNKKDDTKQSTVKADARNEKMFKVKGKFRGQASASAKGASIKINRHRCDEPHAATTDVPDIEKNITAHAEATGVKVDIRTNNKPQSNNNFSEKKSHPKLRMQGKASASATGADVKVGSKFIAGEESNAITLEAHAHAEAKGLEMQIGNKIEKPKFKGASASAKFQATGAAVRLGNVTKAERDTSVSATAESRVVGAELNMGNVSLDKGSSLGVAKVSDVQAGLKAFNFHAGMGGKTGVQASTAVQFGNVALNLGPPSLNISPFAFNLGFGGGIKSSTGTAAKGDKGTTSKGNDNPSSGHDDTTCGNYNQGYGTSSSTATNSNGSDGNTAGINYSSEGNPNSYTSAEQVSTASNINSSASNHRVRGSGSQLSGSYSTSAGNDNSGNTQNAGYTMYNNTSSHKQDTTASGQNRIGADNKCSGSRSENACKLENGSNNNYNCSNPENDGFYCDDNGYVTHLEDSPHSTAQFAYGTGSYSYTDTTSSTPDHMYGISDQHNYMGADLTTNSNSHTVTAGNGSFNSSGHGHTGNTAMENYSTNSDSVNTSTATCHQEPNRKANPVNMSHPTVSTDDQNTVIGEAHALSCNPHQLSKSKESSETVEKSRTFNYQESKQKLTETFIKVREDLEVENTDNSLTASGRDAITGKNISTTSNISPFVFNLGFEGSIKGSTGTAAKGDKGTTSKGNSNPSSGHDDTTCGNYNQGYGTSSSTATSSNGSDGNTACVSGGNINGYISAGQVSTASNRNRSRSNHGMRGSRSQLSGNYSTSAGNDNSGNTQNVGYTMYSNTSSQKQDTNTNSKSGTGVDEKDCGSRSQNACKLANSSDNNHSGSNLQNDGFYFDENTGLFFNKNGGFCYGENSHVMYLEDSPHSASQFAHGTGFHSYTDTTSTTTDHMYDISDQHSYTETDLTTNSNSHTYMADNSSFNSSGHGHTGNSTMENYSTNSDSVNTSTVACHHEPNRKSNPVNMSHPTVSTDDQNTVVGEAHALSYNPHGLPRKLNEKNKQDKQAIHGKYSSSGNSQLRRANHQDVQSEKESKILKNDDLARKVSLVLSKSKASSKKVVKSQPFSRQESKQKLTETFIKVREELEAENTGKSSTANDGDDTTGKNISTSSKSILTKGISDDNDQQDIDDNEEEPIPDEKKKPFGSNKNVFTMDSIKVQKSNKSLQMIGPKVMGFK